MLRGSQARSRLPGPAPTFQPHGTPPRPPVLSPWSQQTAAKVEIRVQREFIYLFN